MKQREIEHDGTTWKVDDGRADPESGLKLLKFRGDDGRDFRCTVVAIAADEVTPDAVLIIYLKQAMLEDADPSSRT